MMNSDTAAAAAMTEDKVVVVDAPDSFAVRDAASANWVVRKVVEARRYAEHVQAWAAAEVRRAEREEAFLMRRFGTQLEEWARRQVQTQHDGRKSVALPAGAVGFRCGRSRLIVADESALLAWCRTNLPQAVKTVQSVAKSTVAEYVKSTGECPSGTELGGGGEHFMCGEYFSLFLEGAQGGRAEQEDIHEAQGPFGHTVRRGRRPTAAADAEGGASNDRSL